MANELTPETLSIDMGEEIFKPPQLPNFRCVLIPTIKSDDLAYENTMIDLVESINKKHFKPNSR